MKGQFRSSVPYTLFYLLAKGCGVWHTVSLYIYPESIGMLFSIRQKSGVTPNLADPPICDLIHNLSDSTWPEVKKLSYIGSQPSINARLKVSGTLRLWELDGIHEILDRSKQRTHGYMKTGWKVELNIITPKQI